jgi:hypothetical protein
VYLKHLVYDGQIAVADPISRRIAFFATESEAEALIAVGRIRVIGAVRKIKALHWIGPKIVPRVPVGMQRAGTPAEEIPGGKDIKSRARYSHKNETSYNPANVWTLIPAARLIEALFLVVVSDCGGTRIRSGDKHDRSQSHT